MEKALAVLRSNDMKAKGSGMSILVTTLKKMDVEDLTDFEECIRVIVNCLKDHNYRLCLGGMECISILVRRWTENMKSRVSRLVDVLIVRFGDTKLQVRESAVEVVLEIVNYYGIGQFYEKVQLGFQHKNHKTRQQLVLCAKRVAVTFALKDVEKKKLVLQGIEMMEDSNKDVREASLELLVALSKIMGNKFQEILQKKSLRPSHAKALQMKMQEDTAVHVQVYGQQEQEKQRKTPPRRKIQRSSTIADGVGISSKMKQTSISSEKQLVAEIAKIHNGMSDTKDWSRRLLALQQLERMATEAVEYACFRELIYGLREPIAEQISDLRSALVRAACNCIVSLAESMQEDFEVLARHIMPSLLKVTMNSTQIMSISGDTCIRKVLRSTSIGYVGVINKFLHGLQNRTQRARCVIYLSLVLQYWSNPHVEKYVQEIATAIPSLIGDAQSEVRAEARMLYWIFIDRFQEYSSAILQKLSATEQRHLNDDRNAANIILSSQEPRAIQARPERAVTARNTTRVNTRAKQKSPEQSNPTRRAVEKSTLQIKPTHSTNVARRVISPTEASSESDSYEASEASYWPNANNITSSDTPHKTMRTEAHSNQYDTSSMPIRAQRVLRAQSSQPIGKPSSGPSRVLQNMEKPNGCTREEPTAKDFQRKEYKLAMARIENEINDSLWSNRVAGFEELRIVLQNAQQELDTISPFASKIMLLFEEHLLDTHHRVCQTVLKLLPQILSCLPPEMVLRRMSQFLPKILAKCCDAKEVTANLSKNVVQYLITTFDNAELLVALKMEHSNPKIRVATLTLINRLIPECSEYFDNLNHTKTYIIKFARLCDERDEEVRHFGYSLLNTFVLAHETNFRSALPEFPVEFSEAVVHYVRVHLPEFIDHNCNDVCDSEEDSMSLGLKHLHIEESPEMDNVISPEKETPCTRSDFKKSGSALLEKQDYTLEDTLHILSQNNSTMEEKKNSLISLNEMMPKSRSAFWDNNFSTLLLLVLDIAKDASLSESRLQITALGTLRCILRCSVYVVEYLGIILEHGIRCCENSVAGFVAEQHINNEIITIYPMQSMQVLHGIMNKSPQCTVAGSRFLHKCFLSAPPAELKEELGSVMQYIAPLFDDQSSMVRKNAVQSVVQLYMLLGRVVLPYINEADLPLRKLITMYINRAEETRGAVIA